MKEFDVVIYHGGCPDGVGGAWSIYHQNTDYDTIYMGYRHGDPLPNSEIIKGKRVAIVDFCFSKDLTLELLEQVKYLVILDHHKSAERNLEEIVIPPDKGEIIFDMTRSGAQIAWDYIFGGSRPWFINTIADRDLWKFELENTKEYCESMFSNGFSTNIEKMEELYKKCYPEGLRKPNFYHEGLLTEGKFLLMSRQRDIERIVKRAIKVKFHIPGKEVLYNFDQNLTEEEQTNLIHDDYPNAKRVNIIDWEKTDDKTFIKAHVSNFKDHYVAWLVDCPREIRSEVGHILADDPNVDLAVMHSYVFEKGMWYMSCRGRNEPDGTPHLDLSKLCSELPNGGGHPLAAGFSIFTNSDENLETYFTLIKSPKETSM